MQKRAAIISLFLILIASLLVSCSQPETQDEKINSSQVSHIYQEDEAETVSFEEDSEYFTDYTVSQFHIEYPSEEYNTGSISFYDGSYYYTLDKGADMGMSMEECRIMKYDTTAQTTEEVYRIEGMEFWLNELKATEKALFWVMEKDGAIGIEKLDLASHEVSEVKSLGQAGGASLETDGDYLAWYEYDGEKATLFAYDILSEKTMTIAELTNVQSPYTRAIISDGITTYVTKDKDCKVISLYDLKAEKIIKEIKLSNSFDPCHTQGNREFILWSQGDYAAENFPIYAYSLEQGKVLHLNTPNDTSSVFAFFLVGDNLFINDSKNNTILCRNITDKKEAVLLQEESKDFSYYSAHPTPQNSYISENMLGKKLILIEQD